MNWAEVSLVFPHQLFEKHPALKRDRPVVLIEDPLFFGDFQFPLSFHKHKLALHRASMSAYLKRLKEQGYETRIIRYEKDRDVTDQAIRTLAGDKTKGIFIADPVDWTLSQRLKRCCARLDITLHVLPTPAFLCSPEELEPTRSGKLSMTSFYRTQRLKRNILIDGDGHPMGGKWTFDTENRRKLPKGLAVPAVDPVAADSHVREAAASVNRDFPDNPGSTKDFCWPVTHEQARKALGDFLVQRLPFFGDYEDAMSAAAPFLFHSALSSSLNIGLLTPEEILQAVLGKTGEIPLNSLEGYVRQVLGWREFMRLTYLQLGVRMRTSRFWGHDRSLPTGFPDGKTGIVPVDETVNKVNRLAYGHHIERLMVLGSFLLLCETDPDEVYRWFMSRFIDAYDWVMVPNVYAMSQFSDGGQITTKPYFCASSYLLRMSDWQRGPWCDLLDGLFWRFVDRHRDVLRRNPRLGPMTANLDRMDPERLRTLLGKAEKYLEG